MKQLKDLLATIGLLAVIGIGVFVWQMTTAVNIADSMVHGVNNVTFRTVATSEAIEQSPVFFSLESPTIAATHNMATSTPIPPTITPTAQPTRPAIEILPLGEGPYTQEQMKVCFDVWEQRIQSELNIAQFGYCQGVVNRGF